MTTPDPRLNYFCKYSLDLTEFLRDNPPLDMVDQVVIENHLYAVQLAYAAWKRGNALKEMNPVPSPDQDRPAQE